MWDYESSPVKAAELVASLCRTYLYEDRQQADLIIHEHRSSIIFLCVLLKKLCEHDCVGDERQTVAFHIVRGWIAKPESGNVAFIIHTLLEGNERAISYLRRAASTQEEVVAMIDIAVEQGLSPV